MSFRSGPSGGAGWGGGEGGVAQAAPRMGGGPSSGGYSDCLEMRSLLSVVGPQPRPGARGLLGAEPPCLQWWARSGLMQQHLGHL